ncbi:hypothetical protein PR048_024217 [Dryococelus australis]|uniref:Uncharacterized protein n=1 Tax=Dryococelus australis TaxID=614101 RepID=A0ABQ9GMZ4_9NEOP|nr:hypothetical protein PR048_024217 [Dryococelus australis]
MLFMDEKISKLKIGLKDIPGMVNSAFTRVSRIELSQPAFTCTGIYQMNRNIVSDLDFQASFSAHLHLSAETPSPFTPACTSARISNLNQISTLNSAESREENPSSPAQLNRNANFTARRRRGTQTEILTSTPYKAQLEETRSDLESGDKKKSSTKEQKGKKEDNPVGKSVSTIKKKY